MRSQKLVVFRGFAHLAHELPLNGATTDHGRRKLARHGHLRQTTSNACGLAGYTRTWFSQVVGISRAYSALGLTLLLWTTLAHPQGTPSSGKSIDDEKAAQTEPAQERSTPYAAVEKPVALHITTPQVDAIPDQDTEVVVELTIDKQGSIVAASLVSGEEPFASAALKEAPNWTFRPARRNDKPVESKIYFLVTFSPPEAPDEETLEPQVEQGNIPQPQRPAQGGSIFSGEVLEEVIVVGDSVDPGGTTITRLEVNNIAGAFGDPLRAIESMPGVTPIASGLPLFFVRGAPPGNVGYFIDGIRVPLLYHAFLGPSVLHPAMIKSVELNAGPMPTRFGRFAGASVEAELAPVDDYKVEGNLRLIDIGAFAQSRFAKERGYVQLSGRYSYTALLISLFSPGTRLDYWDYQGRAGYAIGNRDEISVMGLGAHDYVGADGDAVAGTEYHRIDLRWDHQFSSRDHLRTAVTWGKDRTQSSVGSIKDNLWGARLNFEHRADNYQIRSGADVWVDQYELQIDPAVAEPENYLTLFPTRTDVTGGAFVDVVLSATDNVQVIPGARFDHYTSLGKTLFSVDPRVSLAVQVTKRLAAIHTLGTAHQTPNFVPNVPGAQVGGLEGGLQRSLQAAAQYKYEFPFNLSTSLTLYINGTQQLTDPIGLGQSFSIDETSANARSQGRAYGMELYVKRPLTRRLTGFVSYTLSTSRRSFDRITTRPGYDRPHVLNLALSYEFGWNLRASMKLALASGVPGRDTTLDGFVFDQSRSRPYARLDAKVEKRFIVSDTLNWGIYFEALNATYSGNITSRTCGPEGCKNHGTAPISLPLLGADIAWR